MLARLGAWTAWRAVLFWLWLLLAGDRRGSSKPDHRSRVGARPTAREDPPWRG